jgi:hypothetical protein
MQEYWQEKAIPAIEYLWKKMVEAFMGNYCVHTTNQIYSAIECPCKKIVEAFVGKLSCYIQPTW